MFIYLFLILSIIIGCLGTFCALRIAKRFCVLDDAQSRPDSKKHKTPIPLLGGLGFCFGAIITVLILYFSQNSFTWLQNNMEDVQIIGLLVGFVVIMIGGVLDDIYTYSSKTMLCWIGAGVALTVFLGNLGIDNLSYPFDTLIPNSTIVHQVLAFIWIVACIAATKFLDGLDGLVGSVGIVSFLTIASVASFSYVDQPFIILSSLSMALLLSGFLVWNFPNARVYLGEAGSEAVGYWIGVLSIASGAKIATASSVIGWFVLDILFVLSIRLMQGSSVFKADRQHWHHRLVDNGISKEKAVILTVIIILISSHTSLIIPTFYKGLVILFQVIVIASSMLLLRKRQKSIN